MSPYYYNNRYSAAMPAINWKKFLEWGWTGYQLMDIDIKKTIFFKSDAV